MSNPKFFRNAALIFGLLAAGTSLAEETVTPTPPGSGSPYASEIRSKLANMTPAEREAYRKEMEAKMASMTPEERKALHEKIKTERHERHEMKEEMKHDMKMERQEMHQDRPHTDDMRGASSRGR